MEKITTSNEFYYAYPWEVRFEIGPFEWINKLRVLFMNEEDAEQAEGLLLDELDIAFDKQSESEQTKFREYNLRVRESIVNKYYRGKRPEKREKDDLCAWQHVDGF